jgi:hypothetical protein
VRAGVPFTNGVRFLESRPAATPMPEARATRRPEERRAVRLALVISPRAGRAETDDISRSAQVLLVVFYFA